MAKLNIPIYSDLTPKKKQWVNMIVGGLVALGVVMFVSGFIGGPTKISGPGGPKEPPKPRALASVPGQALDSRDVWVGGAAKDVTRMREDVKNMDAALKREVDAQKRVNRELQERLAGLTGDKGTEMRLAEVRRREQAESGDAGVKAATLDANKEQAARRDAPAAATTAAPSGTSGTPVNAPQSLGGQPRTRRLPGAQAAPGAYPPGQPNRAYAAGGNQPAAGFDSSQVLPVSGLIRVSQRSDASSAGATPAPNAGGTDSPQAAANGAPPLRRVDTYLPVSYTRAVLLGGVAAPTGGQAQSNPVPVLLRLVDAAVLPNQFRGMVRDCLVVAEAFGDQSAERAYIRTTLLSCVMKDGTVLEVPLKGSVFGEDGMNGMHGALVTKQGQILTNALLSGIASGIGSGLAQSTQQVTSGVFGSTTANPTDTAGILKQGVGTGVGKALDRLSQYYIALAEKTFPVIEIQPGRTVDVVVTQGVQLDTLFVNGKPSATATKAHQTQRQLLRTVQTEEDDE